METKTITVMEDYRRYVLVFDISGSDPVLVDYALAANKYRVDAVSKHLKKKYRNAKYMFGLCYANELEGFNRKYGKPNVA